MYIKTKSHLSLFKKFWHSYSLNNLASLWYSVLTTCLQIYIIVRAIYRFSAYISLPWPNGNAPQESINIYMLFISTSILIVPFFIIVSLMKVGNYSNDGRKLGSFDIQKCLRYLNENEETLNKSSWLKIIWKHSLPVGPMLHLLMALCFLFPPLMTEAQLIRHGFLNKSDIWKTDLDFILKKFNGKIFNFFGLVQTINITEYNYIFSDSSNFGQYFIRNPKSMLQNFYELNESGKFSPEFLNLIIALLVLTARYPAVFWNVNKQFSLILTFQLILNSCQSIIAFNAFQVGFKIFICDPTHMLIRFRESSSLNLPQLSLLMFIYLIILQFSSASLDVYGLHKYREYRYARTKYFQNKYENTLLINLLPYLLAMLFFLMLAISVGPLFYEFTIIYCGSLSICALLMLISTIAYFIFWILLWIILATKTVWNFHYKDVESGNLLLNQTKGSNKHASLLITNFGKIFKIKDDLATMAIINFIQSNGFEKNKIDCHNVNHQTLPRNEKSNMKPCHETPNRNFRYSTRTYKNKAYETLEKRINFENQNSDSEGEYTTFHKLKRSYSLNQKKNLKQMKNLSDDDGQDFELACQNRRNSSLKKSANMSNNAAYGIMYNPSPVNNSDGNQDRISDISSGFHSNSSHSSLLSNSQNDKLVEKSNSLESLMQKIEEAAAGRPQIRSISPLQKSTNLLKSQQTEIKLPVLFATFPSETTANRTLVPDMENSSKLIEFTENPDYIRCQNEEFMTPKYLNKQCDFESIPARGCHLRESYCSLHTCICKPDFPINIADRLCISKLKNIGEVCTYNQECQTGSLCMKKNNTKVCHCKTGYIYSDKNKQCVKGLKGASCSKDSDCYGEHMFCSLIMCECKYGYEWFALEESCLKRAKFGENCDTSINCKVYDEFSECDQYSKKCVCGQFLSRKYTLDEVTRRCISCPIHRYNHSSNTCLPEKTTVEYSLLDQSSYERNSLQYGYIALSMAPFIIFALIGFIYRYVNPYGTLPETFDQCTQRIEASNTFDEMTSPSSNSHYCLSIDLEENQNNATYDSQTSCLLTTSIQLPEPPPSYDLAFQDLPPSYDEVIAQNEINVER